MKTRKCNFCNRNINGDSGMSFHNYDLCIDCVIIARRMVCRECSGTGKVRVRDDEATDAQATCGENRTVYRTIECKSCK